MISATNVLWLFGPDAGRCPRNPSPVGDTWGIHAVRGAIPLAHRRAPAKAATSNSVPKEVLEMNLDPGSTALIAIHGQSDVIGAEGAFADFFHAEVANRGVVGKFSVLLKDAREAGATVIYTRLAYSPGCNDLKANSPLLQIAQQRESLKRGGPHTNFIEPLAPRDTDMVVTNQRIGGFTPELATIFEDRGIQTLVFAGVATNISVESSARAASDHGFHVAIVEDCCSAATPDAHAASIESLGLLASITTSSELSWQR